MNDHFVFVDDCDCMGNCARCPYCIWEGYEPVDCKIGIGK